MIDKLIKSKNNISTIFFYAGILAELLVSFSGYLIGGYHENIIIVVGMAMFCISILFDMDIKKDWPIFLISALYGLICYYFQHSAFILRIALAILAGRRQNIKTVFKMFFFGTLFIMIFYGVLSALGLHNTLFVEGNFRSVMERRYSFGFFHPNGYALFLFRTAMMGMFAYIDKMKLVSFIIYSVLFTAFMIPANSKIGTLIIVVGFILFAIGKYFSKKASYILSIGSTVCVALLWLYIKFQDYIEVNLFFHNIWMFVDKVTTGRSGNSYRAMRDNSPTLFGVGFGPETSEMGLVDSIYCQGLVFMIVFILVCILLYRKMIKENNMPAVVIIAVTIMYSVAESFLEYFNKNMIWLLCIGILATGITKIEEDKNVKENS